MPTRRNGPRLSPLIPGLRQTRKGFMDLFGSIPASPGGEALFPDEALEGFDEASLVVDAAQAEALRKRGYVVRKRKKRR